MIRHVSKKQKYVAWSKAKWTVDLEPPVPQQATNDDCGIFAMLCARKIVEAPDRRVWNFRQENIPFYRRLICQMIIPNL
jgi:Ulp1 family protease